MKEKLITVQEKLIYFLLFFSPIIDLINGICFYKLNIKFKVSPGQVIRAVLLLILLYLYLIYKKRNKFILIFVISMFLIQESIFFANGNANLVKDTLFISKIWFNLILIIFLKQYISENKISLNKICECIINAATFIGSVILITKLFKIGVGSYGSIGCKGLFMGLNDITAILTMAMPFSLYKLIFCNNKLKNAINFIIIFTSLFVVGTKTGMIAAILFLVYYICLTIRVKRSKIKSIFFKRKNLIISFIVLILICVISIYLFKFYNETVLKRQLYFIKRLDLLSYILSARNKVAEVAFGFWNTKWYHYIIGVGFTQGSKYINTYFTGHGMIEMDLIDILYFYGIAILLLFTVIIAPTFIKVIKGLLKNTKVINKSFYISFFTGTIISFLGGHVLLSPLAGIYFSIIFASSYKLLLKE